MLCLTSPNGGSLTLSAREEKDPGDKRNYAKNPWIHSEEVSRSTQDDLCPWDFPETHGDSRNEQNSPYVLLSEVGPHQACAGVLWRDLWHCSACLQPDKFSPRPDAKNEWSSLWFCPVANEETTTYKKLPEFITSLVVFFCLDFSDRLLNYEKALMNSAAAYPPAQVVHMQISLETGHQM